MRARIQKISKYAPSIFQGKLDFAGRRAISLTLEHPTERIALRVLAFSLTVLVLLYAYFVSASIINVIARKDALKQIATLASAVASLEREYFAAAQAVDPESGTRLGLVPVGKTTYVRTSEGRVADTMVSDAI